MINTRNEDISYVLKYIPYLFQYKNLSNHHKDCKLALYAYPLFGELKFSREKIIINIIRVKGIQDGIKTPKESHLTITLT